MKAKLIADAWKKAVAIQKKAYAPYSKHPVGACLFDDRGNFVVGMNVENACSNAGICAERSAVVTAMAGTRRSWKGIVVVTPRGGSPCGICRQVLSEFMSEDFRVIMATPKRLVAEMSLGELLPLAFRLKPRK
jgi:cytidine deaminase